MAQDIFIKIDGIRGESSDAMHTNEIEVLEWEWSISQQSNMHSGSGGGAGKCTVYDLTFEHYVDRASPNLMKYCLTGKPIDSAVLVVRKAGGAPLEFLKLSMEQVLISAVNLIAIPGMRSPREEVSLSFASVKQEYVVQNEQGGSVGVVSMGYDIKANKEI
jgi:type VI secretion system secreted protein Hcp